MSHQENYNRLLGRRWRRRGLRLNLNRFSVRRLRAKLWKFLDLLGRCVHRITWRRFSGCPTSGSNYSRRVMAGVGESGHGPRAKPQVGGNKAPRKASYMRSNSFYAQAVAECLEFIKRNSVPAEDYDSVSV